MDPLRDSALMSRWPLKRNRRRASFASFRSGYGPTHGRTTPSGLLGKLVRRVLTLNQGPGSGSGTLSRSHRAQHDAQPARSVDRAFTSSPQASSTGIMIASLRAHSASADVRIPLNATRTPTDSDPPTVARCGTAERPSASASGQVYDYLKFESPVANSSLSSSLSRNFKIRRFGLSGRESVPLAPPLAQLATPLAAHCHWQDDSDPS